MSLQNKIGPVDLLSLNQADRLKYEFASAPSEGAGVRYSWRDPLGRFGMTQFVDVGPETTIWTFDPLC